MAHISARARLANLLGAFSVAAMDRQTDAAGGSRRVTDAAALTTLRQRPHRATASLARTLGRSHSATVRIVDRLATAGLVERRADHDGRVQALTLTEAGVATADRFAAERLNTLGELAGRLNEAEGTELARLLEKILGAETRTQGEAHFDCRLCLYPLCATAGCPIERSVSE